MMTSKEAFLTWIRSNQREDFVSGMEYDEALWQAALDWAAKGQEPVTVTGKLGDICSFHSNKVKKGDCIYLHPAPIHEGWKLVPIEPTDDMCEAGLKTDAYGRENIHSWDDPETVYKAMLAAAPERSE